MPELPTGTVTFLLTDVEGSSRLWERHPRAMDLAIRRHHELIHEEIERHSGFRPADQGEGDSILAAFARASDAVGCALDIQRRMTSEAWPDGMTLKVRIAVHTGEAELRDPNNYAAPPLNRGARLRSLAHGGQILVSESTRDLVRDRPPAGSELRDLGSHRLKDLTHPERVFQLVHPALRDDFPPLRSLEQLPTNLPVQLTSLIGREREIRDVSKLLSTNRLVALTGAAGCGKTRLALQVAADLIDDFADGSWFVDLAPVSDPELVAQTAATAMGLRVDSTTAIEGAVLQPGQDPTSKLIEHIRSRPLLLILDNCEHLIAAAASLVDSLLRSCVNLRILVTSREPLGVAGEATYRVPSLSFPDTRRSPTAEEVAGYDSVHLFVDRASLALSGFALTPENSSAVAQIVGRLGGIPLAIELAAARVKALTPDQIANRLDDQFRLLTGGQRTALERQQTIRAAIDWSHQLLDRSEQMLLRRLSVFAGGFNLTAAEAVCSGDGLEETDVLDLVSELVDKSLVMREDGGAEVRYRMLETIKQYGREKLFDAHESARFRTRHRDHFLSLAQQAEERIQSREAGLWLDILEADIDNIRLAIEWSLADEAGAEPGQQLVSALRNFWSVRGRHLEGLRWLRQVVSKPGDVSPSVRAATLVDLAQYELDLEESRRWAVQGLELASELNLMGLEARAKVALAAVSAVEGEAAASERWYEDALVSARQAGETHAAASALLGLVQSAYHRGEIDRVRSLTQEALRFARTMGYPVGVARTLVSVGHIEEEEGDQATARAHYEEALAAAREVGDRTSVVNLLGRLTRLAYADGDPDLAHELWDEANSIAREAGEGFWMYLLSLAASRRQDYREARRLAEEALSAAREIGAPMPIAYSLNTLGWNAYLSGDLEAALPPLEECERIARSGAGKTILAASLHSLGEARRRAGADARPALEESLSLARETGLTQLQRDALWSLAELARADGDLTGAAELHLEALSLPSGSDRSGVIKSIECSAALLINSEPESAVALLGAAEALRQNILELRPPVQQPIYEEDVAAARAAIGSDEAFEKASSQGGSMSLDEALELALAKLSALTSGALGRSH